MTHRPHRYTHRDANQGEIVEQLRALGYIVLDVSPLGGDALDLLVLGFNYQTGRPAWVQVEVKTDEGKLTPGESAYIDRMQLRFGPNARLPIIVVRSLGDVVRWFGRPI